MRLLLVLLLLPTLAGADWIQYRVGTNQLTGVLSDELAARVQTPPTDARLQVPGLVVLPTPTNLDASPCPQPMADQRWVLVNPATGALSINPALRFYACRRVDRHNIETVVREEAEKARQRTALPPELQTIVDAERAR